MKYRRACELSSSRYWVEAVELKDPSTGDYYILAHPTDGKSFVIVDESERPLMADNIDKFVEPIRLIGLSEFTVSL